MFQNFLFRCIQRRSVSSLERDLVLREYKAYRLDRLNKQLADLQIDALPEAEQVESKVIRKVPLLRWNRQGSLHELQHEIDKRNSSDKSSARLLKTYKWLCVPLMVVFGVHAWWREQQHAKHFDETFSNYVPYPYLRVRTNKMPFGDDQTLFFNPKRNYDPKIHGPRPLSK
jgi:hypothetical protein